MKTNGNTRKDQQLGMPHGTATGRLRKIILFDCIQKLELDFCFHCGKKILEIENFSIEHKRPWLDSDDPVGLFFDLENIAFSHLKCNIGVGRRLGAYSKHGSLTRYMAHGCRCEECKKAKSMENARNRKRKFGDS